MAIVRRSSDCLSFQHGTGRGQKASAGKISMTDPSPNSADEDHPVVGSAVASQTRYLVLVILCAAATFAYIGRNCLAVAADDVSSELNIPRTSMGWVMAAFFWGYALAQIPAGSFAHQWGVRRSLALYAFVWSIACAAMGMAFGFWSLVLFQAGFGVAQAGVFPCSAAAISRWLPISRRAFATGSLGTFMSVGGAIGAAVTGLAMGGYSSEHLVIPAVSWRWVFVACAVPSALWSLWFYHWFRDQPEKHSAVNDTELRIIRQGTTASQEDAVVLSVPWSKVVASFDMWMICGQQFFRAAGYIFFATWFPTFLKETRGVSTAASGFLTALPLLAVVVGNILGGLLVDAIWNITASKRLSRQLVAFVTMLGCAHFIAAAYFVENAVAAVLLISCGSFTAALGGSCGYTVTMEKSGKYVAPIFGAMNMTGNLGAAICPVMVAWIVQWTDNWNLVLVFFAAIYVLAAVCWALINPNGIFWTAETEDQLETE